MCTDLITASRSLRTLPLTRLDMNGSSMAIRPCAASSSTAVAQAVMVATVPGSSRAMRHNIFPPFILAAAVDPGRGTGRSLESNSKAAPASPPRLKEENTTLSSRAPSSSRSSRMSDVASTPSTPGSASAARSRSSRSVRLFMAVGRLPTASAPAAGWSAATIVGRRRGWSGGWCDHPRHGLPRRDRLPAGRSLRRSRCKPGRAERRGKLLC